MKSLTTGDFTEASAPFTLFTEWLEEAKGSEPNDPNAVALATADADGMPNVRMVLLKGFDEDGFVFYTNTESNKGNELAANMKAALCFHWKSLRRQVRVRGRGRGWVGECCVRAWARGCVRACVRAGCVCLCVCACVCFCACVLEGRRRVHPQRTLQPAVALGLRSVAFLR